MELAVCQNPEDSKIQNPSTKARGAKWPLDPPPVVEMMLPEQCDATYMSNPVAFCMVELETIQTAVNANAPQGLTGTTVSSLHKVKGLDSKEHSYFVFGDLNILHVGEHRLVFTMYDTRQDGELSCVEKVLVAKSKPFRTVPLRVTLPAREATPLTKRLADSGIKLRVRKDTSHKRKAPQPSWSADKTQVLRQNLSSLQQTPVLFSASVPNLIHQGEDIGQRLNIASGPNPFGIRRMMDRAPGQLNQYNPFTTAESTTMPFVTNNAMPQFTPTSEQIQMPSFTVSQNYEYDAEAFEAARRNAFDQQSMFIARQRWN